MERECAPLCALDFSLHMHDEAALTFLMTPAFRECSDNDMPCTHKVELTGPQMGWETLNIFVEQIA